MHQDKQTEPLHLPVLLTQVLDILSPQSGESYLDLTAGYGGHAASILEQTQAPERAVLVDRDQNAIDVLQQQFGRQKTEIIHSDFYTASQSLARQGRQFDLILADLGVSSPHLNTASRGFSLQADGPLDMRMDQSQELTAEVLVNTLGEAELADVIKRYGEDPKSGKIANLIVHNRPLKTTRELATIVAKAWPGHHRIHPATRTFQALRIAVNDELELLRLSLPLWMQLLAPNGRLAVISFHSLEDRLVKQFFQDEAGDLYDATLRILTKRPLVGDTHELVSNPRARSAKLRAAAKIKT